jgi:hypothetical protein
MLVLWEALHAGKVSRLHGGNMGPGESHDLAKAVR